jgi:hypothetical protein
MKNRSNDNLSASSLTILELLKQHREGLDIKQIRELGGFGNKQQHLDRRLRNLDPLFVIERLKVGERTVYRYVGQRPEGEWGYEKVSKKLRAKILTRDGRRCRMCGKTFDQDNIKLHVYHKIPENWGGTTVEENLWALCSVCNEGKLNYFASFDADLLRGILLHESVHKRIAELLRHRIGEWVDSDFLEFVANFESYQEDWQKRLRELRYFGLVITTRRRKFGRRMLSEYMITNWVELPDDPSQAAQQFERDRAARNQAARPSGEA